MEILRTTGLTKRYRTVQALDKLDLHISEGTVFGLLGPNGSGKTTALGILLGVIRPSSGSFTWFGDGGDKNPRRRIGALLETPNFYPYLDAVENLRIIAHLKKVKSPAIEELLRLTNLFDHRLSLFKTFSLGMKQRLGIAAALIGQPEVIVLDEPANGLDPQGIAEIRSILRGLARRDKTIILTSHLLGEVEKVCTHVGILQRGKLLRSGPVERILVDDPVIEVTANDLMALKQVLEKLPQVLSSKVSEGCLVLTGNADLTPELLNRTAFEHDIVLCKLLCRKKSLEAEFLKATRNNNP